MDVTNRQSNPIDTGATIRVGMQPSAQSAGSDITVRPGAKITTDDDDDHSGDLFSREEFIEASNV